MILAALIAIYIGLSIAVGTTVVNNKIIEAYHSYATN
jgi:hypothetical protein